MLTKLSDEFISGKRVAISVPVIVRRKDQSTAIQDVRIVLERDDPRQKSNVAHLRSGINISKLQDAAGHGVRGLLLVGNESEEQGELEKLLQASEGPAHRNWELQGEGYDAARSHYPEARRVIQFMRRLAGALAKLLGTAAEEKDVLTLAEFFPDTDASNMPSRGRGKIKRKVLKQPPPGVVLGIVRVLDYSSRGPVPVSSARVEIFRADQTISSLETTDDGGFRFEGLNPGDFRLKASKDGVGEAYKQFELSAEFGVEVNLLLRRSGGIPSYQRVKLSDGFALRGNPDFSGQLRPLVVKLAYAAWGGGKSFKDSDFSLHDKDMTISFAGIRETERSHIVKAPNRLEFTPLGLDFYVEVRGFDIHRALYVDVRPIELELNDPEEPE
jgi:hypothetical protein